MLTTLLIVIGIISVVNYNIRQERKEAEKIRKQKPNKKLYPPKVFKKGK
jgi:hypothetical protein